MQWSEEEGWAHLLLLFACLLLAACCWVLWLLTRISKTLITKVAAPRVAQAQPTHPL